MSAKPDVKTRQATKIATKKTVLVKMTTSQLDKFNLWLKEHQKPGPNTEYKTEYCKGVIDFFKKKCDKPYNVVEQIVKKKDGSPVYNKAGEPLIDNVLVPNTPPYLVEYAAEIGVMVQTVLKWAELHPAFNEALTHAREMRTTMLVNNGLIGLYNPQSWIFASKNLSGMTDRTDITSQGEQVFNVKLQRFDKPGDEENDLDVGANAAPPVSPMLH